MKKEKGYRLDKGFLVDYSWLPALDHLTAEQQMRLLRSLMDYQRSGGKTPPLAFENEPFLACLQHIILPQINNRLQGAVRTRENAWAGGEDAPRRSGGGKRQAVPNEGEKHPQGGAKKAESEPRGEKYPETVSKKESREAALPCPAPQKSGLLRASLLREAKRPNSFAPPSPEDAVKERKERRAQKHAAILARILPPAENDGAEREERRQRVAAWQDYMAEIRKQHHRVSDGAVEKAPIDG